MSGIAGWSCAGAINVMRHAQHITGNEHRSKSKHTKAAS